MKRKKASFPSSRSLYTWEIQEARRVFGLQLCYERVRIHEGAAWPAQITWLGKRLTDRQPDERPYAIALGYHIFFSVRLPGAPLPPSHPEYSKIPWLIHELAHVWQYQHLGWSYLFQALKAQLGSGQHVYDYGGEHWLRVCYQNGWKLSDFNLEQQGEIARSYYDRLCREMDVTAWLPFVTELSQHFDRS
jgi:hypothetical protein